MAGWMYRLAALKRYDQPKPAPADFQLFVYHGKDYDNKENLAQFPPGFEVLSLSVFH
jgi:hypothetical protein